MNSSVKNNAPHCGLFPLYKVFHTLGKDFEAVSKVIERCVNYLISVNTPHTMLFSTGRVFLLPRKQLEEPPFAVVPGFPEVSGQVSALGGTMGGFVLGRAAAGEVKSKMFSFFIYFNVK